MLYELPPTTDTMADFFTQVPPLESQLSDNSLLKTQCYVNGQWLDAASRKTFAVTNPSTLAIVGQCPEFSADDAAQAITAAKTALPGYGRELARTRAHHLRAWYDLMASHADDLARIITAENGKPLADARSEVAYAASFLDWFSEEAPRVSGDTLAPSNPGCRLMTLREPVGVCGLIVPWNFPAAMITRKVGPALAAGCTVVVKAAGETPLTALALAELASRAGIPPGVVNVITGLENTVSLGLALTTHPDVRKVSFTGSTGVGKVLMKQSSSTLKKLSMELGGNAPFIVFEDADLDAALKGLILSKFRISGQTCVCTNRIFVHRALYERFISMTAEAVRQQFRLGDGTASSTTHGPLIHGRAVARVQAHVDEAVSKGARLLLGGGQPSSLPNPNNFFEPTVLADMTPDMLLYRGETFGPVAAIFPFDSEEEVIRLANDSDVGLAGYFYSRDAARCWRVAKALEVGMVGVNTGSISDPAAPFGGVKESGFGREGSKYGIDEFLTTKMVMTGGL